MSYHVLRGPLLAVCAAYAASSVFIPSLAAADAPAVAERATAEEPAAAIDEEIVVSASRVELPHERVGSTVTVITSETIERHRWRTVAEALRSVPGLEVATSGAGGQVTSVFVRGGSSSQTLVLLDGVRLNSATSGAFDFADLTTDGLARIEVLRGPQSTLYGSEAAAGVISLTSVSGRQGLHFSGLAELGEDDHQRLRLRLDGGSDQFDYSVGVTDLLSDGVSAADLRRGNTETDRHENTTADARLGWRFGKDGRVDLTLRHIEGEVENDGFSFFEGPVDDLQARSLRQAQVANLSISSEVAPGWRQSFHVSAADDDLEGLDEDNPFGNFKVLSERLEAGTQADVEIGEQHLLTAGLAWEQRSGGSVGSFDEEVDIASFYLQDQWSASDRFELGFGARWDDHSEFGDELTYRVTLALQTGTEGRLHGSYGTGFKAPTLNDLYFPFFSNPALSPETSEAFDVGFEQRWQDGRWAVDVTYFDSDFEDLIAFDFVTFTPQNIASATSSGVEASLRFRSERVEVGLSHTYNDTEDNSTGLQLARRPENRSVLDLFFRPTDQLRLSALVISVSDRIDSDGSVLEDYERMDLAAQYEIDSRFEPFVRVLNVLDDEYSEVAGYGSRGRTAIVGLSFDL